jgi:hypothetical protein
MHSFARLVAGPCRALGLEVREDPLEDNPTHGALAAPASLRELDRLAKRLRDMVEWLA